MELLRDDPFFELVTILGCSAVLEKFGDVHKIIENDGFHINEKVYHLLEGNSTSVMAKSTALGIYEASSILDRYKPDYVIIVGDRYEMMSFVISAAYSNTRIIHTMGGEITGTIDESIRHAITKFSHIHFVATEVSRNNLIRMGEDPDYVFNVGCPRLDLVDRELQNDSFNVLTSYFQLNKGVGFDIDFEKPFVLLSQHSVTTEYDKNREYINNTLNAILKFGIQTIVLWPNSDAGGNSISKGIRTFREKHPDSKFNYHKNLPNHIYIHLMNSCFALVGNSSSGIREGAFIGTPVINIGTRQNTREQGKNVINVPNSEEKIFNALQHIKAKNINQKDKIYGDGNSSQKIIEILKKIKPPAIQKTLKFHEL